MAETTHTLAGADPYRALRHERDRFVALAFSAADILLELDRNRTVVFCAGTTAALLGVEPEALRGRPFAELVAGPDRAMIDEALAVADAGGRLNGLVTRLEGAYGVTPPLVLLGYQLPEMDDHFFLAVRLGAQEAVPFLDPSESGLTESGLPGAQSFAELAADKLAVLAQGDADCRLTLYRCGGLEALRESLDEEARGRMNTAIGGCLRANALGGELAGELDGESYGVIHPAEADLAALAARLEEITREADPAGRGVGVRSASIELDPGDASESVKALGYIFTRFADAGPDDFQIERLSDGLSSMVDDAVHRMTEFRSILNNADFTMAFQPVVDLKTQRPHHFEALARFEGLARRLTPYEAITFAEQTGLILDFDLAMCAKVLDWLDQAHRQGRRYKVAINLSGSSIGSPGFVGELGRLLQRYDGLRDSVLFEITESAKIRNLEKVNGAVQSLRRAGHKVCLDDFGAGAAAFQYLRELDVDVVKIDGAYVKGALRTPKGMAFLKAMAGLCNDLGITTVAEMVEDEDAVRFLRQCGVRYGQGFLFGRPSVDIGSFDTGGPTGLASSGGMLARALGKGRR